MEASSLGQVTRSGLLGRRSPLLRLQGDERLVGLLRAGHDRAFEVLFDRYHARLLAFCRHMLGSSEDAEDVLQEVFTKAHAAILADQRHIHVRPWLYRIARNRCLNHLRKPVPEGKDTMDILPHDGGTTTAERVQSREEFRALVAEVQGLPETQRTALLLREIEALSYEDIGTAMDTTVPAVKSLLVRARMSLAEATQARLLSCGDVQLELAEAAEGLRKVSAPVRRHVRDCKACKAYRSELRKTGRELSALAPAGLVVWLHALLGGKLLGFGSSAGGSSATGAAGAGSGAAAGGAASAGGAAASGAAAGGATLGGAAAAAGGGLGGAVVSKAAAGIATAALITAGAVEVRHLASPKSGAEPAPATARAGDAPTGPTPVTAGAADDPEPAKRDRRREARGERQDVAPEDAGSASDDAEAEATTVSSEQTDDPESEAAEEEDGEQEGTSKPEGAIGGAARGSGRRGGPSAGSGGLIPIDPAPAPSDPADPGSEDPPPDEPPADPPPADPPPGDPPAADPPPADPAADSPPAQAPADPLVGLFR